MTREIVFDPSLPLWLIAGVAAVALAGVALAAARGLPGWWLRLLATAALVAALLDPSLQSEDRERLSDILLIGVDGSASQTLSDRAAQTEAVLADLLREAEAEGLDTRVVRIPDGDGDSGTQAMTALSQALAEVPRSRVAGAVLISDGRIHDADLAPDLPAPLHLLRTGRPDDWDRRLVVSNAPAFAILDEEFTITLRVDDQGAVPDGIGDTADITLSIDGGPARPYRIPVGVDLELPVILPHGGLNVMEFRLADAPDELTDRNNAAIVQINGVRDRLRVLLVSGEPHPGQRTWRNLLKADAAVDLVHFTILRPPGKQDGVPVTELSLIAFPTRELFFDKIDEFDLIVFDRYQRRGILPSIYLDNVRQYVEDGGALLIAAGPDYATADSIYRSPLASLLPAEPTARVLDGGYTPTVSELGERHPVTTDLPAGYGTDEAPWGRWFRQVQVDVRGDAQVAMTGTDDEPLLVLDRAGEGRVAFLGSDQAWLWDRGYEGGGPQAELLRRLAHWLMQEPELEEEALTAAALGSEITITRRTLGEGAATTTVTAPDGTERIVALEEEAPGRFVGRMAGEQQGLYRIAEGDRTAVIGLGPAAPREFVQTIATDDVLQPVMDATNGGSVAAVDGTPDLRAVREGRSAVGRGWLGYTPRDAYLTADIRLLSLVPPWLFLLLAAGLMTGAWLREGRA
ncbi:hypothetical protein [Jannaschia sp. LMIT008]|uniref:hypothetical protein n=1 Tax=Jannaschia maritima TaxID=3032585 RepID=UPI002810DD39|nr:hypothetical protein [Jannaschia sp. LMIT008]